MSGVKVTSIVMVSWDIENVRCVRKGYKMWFQIKPNTQIPYSFEECFEINIGIIKRIITFGESKHA